MPSQAQLVIALTFPAYRLLYHVFQGPLHVDFSFNRQQMRFRGLKLIHQHSVSPLNSVAVVSSSFASFTLQFVLDLAPGGGRTWLFS